MTSLLAFHSAREPLDNMLVHLLHSQLVLKFWRVKYKNDIEHCQLALF